MSHAIQKLSSYIKENGGVSKFAAQCGVSQDLVYKWLRQDRQIRPKMAAKIERETGGQISKESLIFGHCK